MRLLIISITIFHFPQFLKSVQVLYAISVFLSTYLWSQRCSTAAYQNQYAKRFVKQTSDVDWPSPVVGIVWLALSSPLSRMKPNALHALWIKFQTGTILNAFLRKYNQWNGSVHGLLFLGFTQVRTVLILLYYYINCKIAFSIKYWSSLPITHSSIGKHHW